jgi:hypothetical protein
MIKSEGSEPAKWWQTAPYQAMSGTFYHVNAPTLEVTTSRVVTPPVNATATFTLNTLSSGTVHTSACEPQLYQGSPRGKQKPRLPLNRHERRAAAAMSRRKT